MKKFVKSILLLPLLVAGVSCYETDNNDTTTEDCPTCPTVSDTTINHSLSVENEDIKLLVEDTGTTKQIKATATPSSDTITYSSSDESVAKVSSSGVVTGVKANSSCEITIKSSGGVEKKIPVTTYDNSTYFTYYAADTVLGCVDSEITELTLPTYFPDGSTQLKYAGIANNTGFWGLSKLTKLVIPEGYTTIRECVFAGLVNLKEVVLPSTLTSLAGSFYNCPNINSITFRSIADDESVSYVSSNSTFTVSDPLENGSQVLYGSNTAYLGFNNPNGLLFSEDLGITTLGKYSYFNLDSMVDITVPSTVINCVKYAISSRNLISIDVANVGRNSSGIDDAIVCSSPKLETITGNATNGAITTCVDSDGNPINAMVTFGNSTYLIRIGTKNFAINDNTKLSGKTSNGTAKTDVAANYFSNALINMGLEEVFKVPTGIVTIEPSAFLFNSELTGAYVPNTVADLRYTSVVSDGYNYGIIDPDTNCPYSNFKLYKGRKTVSSFYGCNDTFTIYYQTRSDGKSFAEAFPTVHALLKDEVKTYKTVEVTDSSLEAVTSDDE